MTDTQTDANSFLMGGGVRSAKFAALGDTVKGTILGLDMQQQRDYATGESKFWDDGRPMMQLRVVLDTGAQEDEEDDGTRALYVRGQMQQAVKEAVKGAGASRIEVGGTLAVRYERDGEPSRKGFNPPKQYVAKYEPPPAASVDAADLF